MGKTAKDLQKDHPVQHTEGEGFAPPPGPVPDEWANVVWESVSEDEGDLIDWNREPEFVGTYRGRKTVSVPSQDDPTQMEDVTLYLFSDVRGNNRSAWENYRLGEAMKDGKVSEGDRIRIVQHGKANLDGGRTLNRMSIYKAQPAATK